MLIHKDNMAVIVAEYMDKHILPKATGWNKITIGAVGFIASNRLGSMLNETGTVTMLTQTGIMDESGYIDMDFLRDMATSAFSKSGGKTPPVMGYSFDSSDIEGLYETAKRLVVGEGNA